MYLLRTIFPRVRSSLQLRGLATAAIGLAAIAAHVSTALAADDTTSRYVVRYEEAPLAMYAASERAQGRVAIPSKRQANGRERLDVHSAEARSYVDYLQAQQDKHFGDIAATLGRFPFRAYAMQHAVNAEILELSATEARRLAHMPGIDAVEADRLLPLASDVGPGLVGAASVWWGAPAAQDSFFARSFDVIGGYLGDGVVVGMIDTGYNSLSPSFQETDMNGYHIENPLGHGNFLGQCNVPGISRGGCNDKVIGVYDEFTPIMGGSTYTVEDGVGHGSHTASVAAGNFRSATLGGYTARISGIAPHANLVIYRVCSPGGCSWASTVAAVDHSIADGQVDVLNYSISGVGNPWYDSASVAFLSAASAGIFVSTAAGNTGGTTGQVAGTVMNQEPWVATIAAGTHSGGALVNQGNAVVRAPTQPDQLTGFSLLGPTTYNVIKPDLQAPGAQILGAGASDGTSAGTNFVMLCSGTSMAAPVVTGSGALLLGLHPDWTALEVKSALMMTAKESGLTKADGTTASDYFDRGSGRVQDFLANNAGLVMDETEANFHNANPEHGGDPRLLNLPSMQNANCANSCTFVRTVRSTQDHAVTWTAHVEPAPGSGPWSVAISPSTFKVKASALSAPLSFTIDSTNFASDGLFHFAEVVLTADDTRLPPLHLPLAIAVPAS
jgi:hypothetical protein